MEFLKTLDWGTILGALAAISAAALVPWIKRVQNALNKLTDAVASESANGAGITKDEWQAVKEALLNK